MVPVRVLDVPLGAECILDVLGRVVIGGPVEAFGRAIEGRGDREGEDERGDCG